MKYLKILTLVYMQEYKLYVSCKYKLQEKKEKNLIFLPSENWK